MQVQIDSPVITLEQRLARGVELLFEMEQQGDLGGEYERYLRLWYSLLDQYELMQSA